MVDLMDIAPARRVVSVLGQEVEVRGISVRGACVLLGRFPKLWEVFNGADATSVGFEKIAEIVPDAIEPILAAGTGHAGDAKAEAHAAQLDLQSQGDLFAPIMELTMPRGFGPFVETLTKLSGMFSLDIKTPLRKGSAKSPQPSSS